MVEAFEQRAYGYRLVDVDRRAQLDRHARRHLGEPVPLCDLVGECLHRVGLLRRRPPVQDHTDPRLAFDELGRNLRFELGRRRSHRDEIRPNARIDRVLAVDRLFHAVETDELDPVDRKIPSQKPDRATTHDRDPPETRDEARENRRRFGQRARIFGAFDDRRQRSVEVEQQRGARRAAP